MKNLFFIFCLIIFSNVLFAQNSYTETVNGVSFEMISVKGGTFQMGGNIYDLYGFTEPIHSVTIRSFQIGKYEVTQELWKTVMGTNPSKLKGDSLPVEQIRWQEAQNFIKKLNKLTGKNYRLPTEAEWEYAARGGNKSQGNKFAGINIDSHLGKYANFCIYDFVSGGCENGTVGIIPVGSLLPNELGIYDMSGNVDEWCQDKFHKNYKNAPTDGSAWETGKSLDRVLRGGGYFSDARGCQVTTRGGREELGNSWTDKILDGLGFRLVLTP